MAIISKCSSARTWVQENISVCSMNRNLWHVGVWLNMSAIALVIWHKNMFLYKQQRKWTLYVLYKSLIGYWYSHALWYPDELSLRPKWLISLVNEKHTVSKCCKTIQIFSFFSTCLARPSIISLNPLHWQSTGIVLPKCKLIEATQWWQNNLIQP